MVWVLKFLIKNKDFYYILLDILFSYYNPHWLSDINNLIFVLGPTCLSQQRRMECYWFVVDVNSYGDNDQRQSDNISLCAVASLIMDPEVK